MNLIHSPDGAPPEGWADEIPDPSPTGTAYIEFQPARGRIVIRYLESSVAPARDVVLGWSHAKRIAAAILHMEAEQADRAALQAATQGLKST